MKLNLEIVMIVILLHSLQTKVHSQQLENCPNIKRPEVLLSRKKRSLKFPDGSSFVISQAFGQGLLVGWNLGWYSLYELDVLFKVPGFSDMIFYKYRRNRLHKRQKRDLLKGIEGAINIHGINGKFCVLRSVCEVKYLLSPKYEDLVEDFLRIFLDFSEDDSHSDQYIVASKEEDCNKYSGERKCPFSLLEAFLYSDRLV